MSSNRMLASTVLLAAGALAGCAAIGQGEQPPDGRQPPVARNSSDCIASVGAILRTAPASASDPATGAWLGRVDHLRDEAKALGDTTGLAGELDLAGAEVALNGFPPQLAIVPARETCGGSDAWLDHSVASASAASAAQAWLRQRPPPARPGMIAGIIVRDSTPVGGCPSPRHGSAVAMGNGCTSWSLTLVTATGTLHASCGDLAAGAACTSATTRTGPREFSPDIGDELYVPATGQISRAHDITVISAPPQNGAWEAGVKALIKQAEVAR